MTLRTNYVAGDPDPATQLNLTNQQVNSQASFLATLPEERLLGAVGEQVTTHAVSNQIGTGSGILKLSYFTALRDENINTLRFYLGNTAASGTPTLCKLGIWTSQDDGALLSRVATTASTPSLITGTVNSRRTVSLTGTLAKVRGQRYAIGLLAVYSSGTPLFAGRFFGVAQESGDGIRKAGQIAGLTDLPTTAIAGDVADASSMIQFHVF